MAGHKKILCIEDDHETAALIAEELTDRGYDVTLAHDGGEGLAAILRTMPDLVLSDISMPVMSGFELLERLTEFAPQFCNAFRIPHRTYRSGQRAQRPPIGRR